MMIKKQLSCKIFLTKVSKNINHQRTMFTLKNASKKMAEIIKPFLKKSYSTATNQAKNISEEKHIDPYSTALSFFKTFSVFYNETKYPIQNVGENLFKNFGFSKALYMTSIDSNFLIQSILMNYFMKQMTIPKDKLFKFVQEHFNFKENQPIFILEDGHLQTSVKTLYEFLVTLQFAKKHPYVYQITYKSEHPKSRNLEQQNFSQKMTGQKNSDVEITFQTKPNTFIIALLDIKIGQRIHHKGNLKSISIKDKNSCYKAVTKYNEEFKFFKENYSMSIQDEKALETALQKIKEIELNSNSTIQNKLIEIQKEIPGITQIIRNYNPMYNPHYYAFSSEEDNFSVDFPKNIELIQKIAQIPEIIQFGPHSTNKDIYNAFEKSLRLFLLFENSHWNTMSLNHRECCLDITKRFFSDFELDKIIGTSS